MSRPTVDGTSQAARRRPELDPAFAALDGRSTADLLAFARAFAGGLLYVDDQGQPQGDWQGLFPDVDGLVEAADYLRAPERFSAERAAPHARPHFALLLAALDLLGLARDQLNGLTGRHLEYFYRQVLRMVGKPAVADRLHVLLVPGSGVQRLRLPAGTLLKAGKDAAGRERLFRTCTDGLASPARVAELRSLRVDIRTTDIRQASRQYLVGGTRQQAFMAMWRIVLGDPLPGDALPVPVLPGLPPAEATGAPPPQVDFDTLVQADRIVAFVADGLGWPLFDDFRRLMQLRAERLSGDAGDWQAINRLLADAGRRRDPAFVLPPAAADDFHANLRAALGLSAADYRQLYNRLPEVDSVEDAFSLLDREPDVQTFVCDELHLPLDDFKALMQLKLRLDGQWAEIAGLIEAGGQRRDPARLMTPEQRAVRNTDALLAAAYARLDWPVPDGLDGLHAAFQAIEAYFCLPAEAFHFIMGVARRSLARPPTQGADTAADDAEWARVHALCAEANAALQFRRRRERLQRAAAPGLAAGDPARALVNMLTAVLGEPLALDDGLQRLAGLGVGAADLAALQALARPLQRASPADWQRAAAVLEVAQRNRQAFVPAAPERVLWHHAYTALDATAVRAPGQAADAPAPRWRPFGSLAAATQRQVVPAAVLGWAVASPLLALAEGHRSVQWWLGLDGDPSCFDDDAMRRLLPPPVDGSPDAAVLPGSVHPFQVECSGAEGWLVPATVQVQLLQGVGTYPAAAGADGRGLRTLLVSITLQEQQPAVVPPSAALHGLDAPQPLLRLLLRPAWDEAQDRHHTAYQTLARLRLQRWRLAVSVSGLASLALRNDGGVLDPKKPFEPFGPMPSSGARLSLGHAELVGKSLDRLVLRGAWMGAPVSLTEHYRLYEGSPKPESFTLRAGLRDGPGFTPGPDTLPLFGADRPGAWAMAVPLAPETGRLMTEPPASDDVADWRRCWVLELAGDLQHAAYPARALRKSMEMAAAVAASMTGGAKPVADAYVVNPPYTPKLKSLVADYSASAEQPAVLAAPGRNSGVLLHWHPFGHEALVPTTVSTTAPATMPSDPTSSALSRAPEPGPVWVPGAGVPLLPAYAAEGEFYIGLASVQAPQRLSLLFQVAEGTADPDAQPQPVRWSVLSGNRWRSLQAGPLEGSLLADGTRGLVQSGIVELQLPAVAPSTLMPGADRPAPVTAQPLPAAAGRYWLRLQRDRAIEGVCDLVTLHPHAVLAEREILADTPPGDDLADPLPAGSVSGPLEPVPGLARLLQPYSGFGGRSAEQGVHFNTRVSERLRHRQRALTPWDYEHLVLEQFPQLHKVKCLRADALGGEPGRVDLVVVPDIANRFPFDPFAPQASADLIRDIEAFLADKTPAFAQLRVKNPYFVALKVRCGVRFMPGSDEGYCRDRLNHELNRFLSPWAYDEGADLVIGGSIYANSIIDFIEQRDYVDYIAGLRLFTVEQGRPTLVPEGPGYHASANRPDAVLVAAASHEFDVIALTDYRLAGFGGIGNLRIELDFSVG